jgi:hypothetical protein
MAAQQTYLGAVSAVLAQGALTAAWIASGELPKPHRRAVRAGAAATVAAYGWWSSRRDSPDVSWRPDVGLVVRKADGTEMTPEERMMSARATGVATAFGIAMILGRRQVEKMWLARLRREGHEHPHRALALRLGLMTIAGALPARLLSVHKARRDSA